MTWPVLAFWCLLGWGLFSRGPLLIYLFFASAGFGSLAVIPVEMAGGINLLPQPVTAAAIVVRVMMSFSGQDRAFAMLGDPRRLGYLALFLTISLVTTLIMPRLFQGAVDVVSMAGARQGPQPLTPGTHNFTQTAYLVLSVSTVVAFAVLAEQPRLERLLRQACLVGGVAVVGTGVLAVLAEAVNAPGWLDPFRTVSYVLLPDDETLGAQRLVGLMPEASSFGALCVLSGTTLAFLQPCWAGAGRALAVGTSLALFVLAALSTSSTAYAGLAVCGAFLAANGVRRFFSDPARRRATLGWGFLALTGLTAGTLGIAFLVPHVLSYAADMVSVVLFQKVGSASYLERMQWNETAMHAFLDTGGLGVGLGSARASNWFVALFSNTGVIGGSVMMVFIIQTLRRRAPRGEPLAAEMIIAFKASLIVALVLGALAGTSPDFGAGVGALYGMVAGLALRVAPLPSDYVAPGRAAASFSPRLSVNSS